MPTRSYYFPTNFHHLEEILRAEPDGFPKEFEEYYRAKGIPPIPRDGALPLLLGISPKTIHSIRLNPRRHYRSFPLRKKDGTERQIDTPRTYLKVIQWWILDNILDSAKVADNVFGFVVGRSAIQNAQYHFGADHILNVDIQQFFPSILLNQVQAIYSTLGYPSDVCEMLAELCCLGGHVPQGAPTSPALANLVLADLDVELSSLATLNGCKYSRYADDLTFSSQTRIDDLFLLEVSNAVERAGFALKPAKTRFAGRGDRMEVTGVVINETLQPTRIWRKKTRAHLHRLELALRLTRQDIYYLYGIRGMAVQYLGSHPMGELGKQADALLAIKAHTAIGYGQKPILPNKLTLLQAEALANLAPRRTNIEIGSRLNSSESAVKKRLQEAFRKIGATDRKQAEKWSRENL